MDKLRIIGLDDDNHAPCFLCEEGTRFESYKELVDFLCNPHDCEIEVRMFAIIDPVPPTCGLVDFTYEEIDDMFYHLEGIGGKVPAGVHPDLVFELFWCAANRRHW